MDILGISCYYHDAAAVLLRDGQLVAAAEEERFTRIKHDFGFPHNAIQFCLETGDIRGSDLDYVVFFEKPFRKFDRILMTVLQTYPQSWKVFRESMITWMIDKLWVGSTIESKLGVPKEKALFCEHHASELLYPLQGEPSRRARLSGSRASGRGLSRRCPALGRTPSSLGLVDLSGQSVTPEDYASGDCHLRSSRVQSSLARLPWIPFSSAGGHEEQGGPREIAPWL
jgi:hypothetical protein